MSWLQSCFDPESNSFWTLTHLHNRCFALQRLLHPDVYTQLQFVGWLVSLSSGNTDEYQQMTKLFEFCATIPNEWRQQFNLTEVKVSNENTLSKSLTSLPKTYSRLQVKHFLSNWLLDTKLIVPNFDCLAKNDHTVTKSEIELLSSRLKRNDDAHRPLDPKRMQLRLWLQYDAYNEKKWANFVDYKRFFISLNK